MYRFLFFIFLAFISCKKDIEIDFNDIAGDYEWHHSTLNITTSEAFDSQESNYGLRITNSGKLKYYIDGKKEFMCTIKKAYKLKESYRFYIGSEKKETELFFSVENKVLRNWKYPFDDYLNEFILIE